MSSALDVPNVSNNFGGCVTKHEEIDKKCGVDARSMSTSESDNNFLRIVLHAGVNTVVIVKDDKEFKVCM